MNGLSANQELHLTFFVVFFFTPFDAFNVFFQQLKHFFPNFDSFFFYAFLNYFIVVLFLVSSAKIITFFIVLHLVFHRKTENKTATKRTHKKKRGQLRVCVCVCVCVCARARACISIYSMHLLESLIILLTICSGYNLFHFSIWFLTVRVSFFSFPVFVLLSCTVLEDLGICKYWGESGGSINN